MVAVPKISTVGILLAAICLMTILNGIGALKCYEGYIGKEVSTECPAGTTECLTQRECYMPAARGIGMAHANHKYCLTPAADGEDPCHTPIDFTGNKTMSEMCEECSTCDTDLCNGKKPIAEKCYADNEGNVVECPPDTIGCYVKLCRSPYYRGCASVHTEYCLESSCDLCKICPNNLCNDEGLKNVNIKITVTSTMTPAVTMTPSGETMEPLAETTDSNSGILFGPFRIVILMPILELVLGVGFQMLLAI